MKIDTTLSRGFAWLGTLCALFALSSAIAFGQLINGRFITSVYTWQQFDTVGVSKKFARGFQSALFDIAQGDFSVHANFQGAVMLQHQLDELPDYRLYYAYAQWKNIADIADVSFGRLPFFAGVGNGTLDGALTRFHSADNKLRMTFYGGANVPLDLSVKEWGPLKKSFTVGGQIITTAIDNLKLGVSYMNRQRERVGYYSIYDSLFVAPLLAKEQYASGDGLYFLTSATVHVRYDYNVDYKKTQRAQVDFKYNPTDCWSASVNYIHRDPQLPYGSFFSVFNVQSTDEFEGGLDHNFAQAWRGFIRGAYVKYTDDNSFRYTLGIANDYGSLSYRGNTGYAGELNSFSAQCSYPLTERKFIPSAGISYISYKLNAEDKTENTVAILLGCVARPLQMLSFDVQGQWLNNKIYKSDFRLYAGLNIWFTEQLNFFE